MPAKTISQLPHDSQICVHYAGNEIQIVVIDSTGRFYVDPLSGEVLARIQLESIKKEGFEVFRVSSSACEDGWGPLLYDIAMEHATKSCEGLLTSNNGLSKEAENMWKHYRDKRNDIQKCPLDANHPLRKSPSAVWNDFPYLWKKQPQLIDQLTTQGRFRQAKSEVAESCTDFRFVLD